MCIYQVLFSLGTRLHVYQHMHKMYVDYSIIVTKSMKVVMWLVLTWYDSLQSVLGNILSPSCSTKLGLIHIIKPIHPLYGEGCIILYKLDFS